MQKIVKCSVCGNKNENKLFNESEYIYCAVCNMRTSKSTGKPYVIKCQFCGRKTVGNTISCMFCGNSLDPTEKPTKGEREASRRVVSDYEKTLSPLNKSTKKFWKYSFRRRRIIRNCFIVGLTVIAATALIMIAL